MKKIWIMLVCFACISLSSFAQQKEVITKTSTLPQKVHNTFSSHKEYNGYKVKKKRANRHKTVHKVNEDKGIIKDKSKKAGDIDKKVEEKKY